MKSHIARQLYITRFLQVLLIMVSFFLFAGQREVLAASGDIITIAGGGVGDGGQATSAPMAPYSIFIDNFGNTYIADIFSNGIRKVNGQGGIITTIAGVGSPGFSGDGDAATNAALKLPRGVYVDSSGIIYIADSENHRIRKISADGIITTIAGNGTAGYSGDGGEATAASLNRPFGITGDANGNIYFSDYGNHRVRKIDTSGIISTFAGNGVAGYSGDGGPANSAMLYSPVGLAVDFSGNVYIAAVNNHAIRKVNTLGIISTFAGGGTPGVTGDGGPATSAYIPAPEGISFDATGALYIADSSDNRIRKVGTNGIITTVAGTGLVGYSGDGAAAVSASLSHPTGVVVDPLGGFCIADGNNNRIRCVSPVGVITTVAGSGAFFQGDGLSAVSASLAGPVGISADSSGAVIITDQGNQRVRRIDPSGLITTIAGNGTAGFSGDGGPAVLAKLSSYAYGISQDSAGKLYIADAFNSRIRKIDLSGVITTVAGNGTFGYNGDIWAVATSASLNQPLGVVADASGNIFIADAYNHRIRKVAANGSISTVAGTGTAGFSGDGGAAVSANLNLPIAVALDSAGNLLITDRGNHRIRKVNGMGIISTIAGNGITGYSGDGGAATSASLNYPGGVAMDGQGNMYVADTTNRRVRKIDGTGMITTVAGNGTSGYSGDAGSATAASIYSPAAVFVDSVGNLLISDTGNNRIRKVVFNGITGTIKINSGAAYTVTAAVSLHLSCVSAAGSCVEMQFSPDGVDWSAPVEGFSLVKAWTLSSEEGVKDVYVKFKDDANNWSSAYRASITLDAFPPTVSITSPQQGTTNDNHPTLLYTVSDGTVTVKVDGVTVNKVSGNTLDTLTEGTHTVRVESKDVSGNIGFDEITFTVDTPPTVTITAPTAGVINSTTPLLTYTVSNGAVVAKVDGAVVSKVSGNTLDPLADGTHIVKVEATDAGGTGFAERTFTIDTVAPSVSITSPTAGTTTDNQPLLTYAVSDGTVTVKVDGLTVSTVSGGRLPALTNGSHTVRVESVDAAGNTGFAEVTLTVNAPIISYEDFESGTLTRLPWVTSGNGLWAAKTTTKHGGSYSAEAPVSITDSQSAGMEVSMACTSGNISFWFSVSSEANYDYLTFYVDGVQKGRWSGTVPWTQATFPVTAGTHIFKWVYSKDSSVSAGSDTAWVDDIVFPVYIPVPTVTISSPLAGVTNNNRPVLTYVVSDGAVVVKVDGIVVSKVSGDSLDALADGQHMVRVEATNGGGTGSAQTTFTVDTTAPSLGFNPVATPTAIGSQTITGTRETNATITVSANTSAQIGVVSYPTSTTWSVGVTGLVEGVNIFTVTATDGATNSASSAITITLDTIAPQVSMTSPQAGITNSRTPVLTYTMTEGIPTVTIDGVVVTKASGDTLGPLADGLHTVRVSSVDAAGNSGFAEVSITVDATAPTVTITSPTAGTTNNATPVLSFTLSEGTAVVTVDGIVLPLNSGDILARLADGPHTVRADATDAAGNPGFAEVSFTVDTLAPNVSISSPVSGIGNNSRPVLNFTTSEGTIVVKVDGAVVMKTSGDALDTLTDGFHVVRVEATDSANNFGFAEASFTIDTIAPTVTITSPVAGPTGVRPVLAFTTSDGVVAVKVDGIVVNKMSGDTLDTLSVGPHLVRVEATDAAGNAGFAEVSFSVASYTVALSAGPNGSINGPGTVMYGDMPTYTFLPSIGYHIADVTINGVSVGAVTSYSFTTGITANTVIAATFAIDTFAVTMTGDLNGTVTGPATVNYGGSASYTITSASGYHVVDVLVDDVSVGAVSNYSFTNVTAEHAISASFAINSYSITATAGANGSISGPASVNYGSNAAYTITPATGYHVVDVLVDGVSVGPVTGYSFINVTVEHTISASFAINSYSIAASAGANGSISGPASVNYGGSASYTITPATGYHVADVLVDGVSAGAVTSYGFTNVTVEHTISASFAINSYSIAASAGTNGSISGSTSVNYGGSAAYTITPTAGYHVADVLVDGVSAGAVTSYSFSNVTTNHTISASFAINSYSIAASAGANGSLSGLASVNYGGSAAYTITPATGYHVADVLVDSVSAGAVTSYTFSNITTDHTITVSFAINSYSITATAGANGSISGPASVNYGSNAAYTITPAAGYHVADVLVDGVSAGPVTGYSFSNVTVDHTIAASFAINSYSIAASAGANGSISGPASVNYGGSAAYTITPATGYHVSDVLVDGVSAGAVTSYTISNVTADHTITASFAINSYSITATAGANGSISGPASVNYGGSAAYTITPANGYHVTDVLVDGVSAGAVTSYSFSNVTANHAISASFAINSYSIAASAGANGSISGPAIVNYGGSAAYTITPATGYHVTDVLVDGVSVGAVTSYSFSNVTANHTIAASFAINSYSITATAGANGSISGPASVNYGASASYTITPIGGYGVAAVLVDGVSVGAVTSYTFSNVVANHTISVTFAALPDLISTGVTAPANATRGRSANVSATIKNQGGGNAGGFSVSFYLSTNNSIASSDTLLGTTTVASLNAGGTTTVSGSFTVPSGMSTGKYYVGVIVDSGDAVIESSESNNSKAAATTTTIK